MNEKLVLLLDIINQAIADDNLAEALTIFTANKKEFYAVDPLKTITLHISLLFISGEFSQALDEVLLYKDMAYVSQEVEDKLRSFEQQIKLHILKLEKARDVDEDAIKKMFLSENFSEVLVAFNKINRFKLDAHDYIKEVSLALKKDYGHNTLFALSEHLKQHFKGEKFIVCYFGDLIEISVDLLPTLYEDKGFIQFIEELELFNKNITIYNFARELAERNVQDIYPFTYEVSDSKALAVYFAYQAKLALQEVFDEQLFFQNYNITNETIKNIVKSYHLAMFQG